jgi:hypothetical protein
MTFVAAFSLSAIAEVAEEVFPVLLLWYDGFSAMSPPGCSLISNESIDSEPDSGFSLGLMEIGGVGSAENWSWLPVGNIEG